ncbi:hypothetical protein GCK32_008697 [Trichostrongylus colubriformis]|uniref:Phosphoinositide phospholipase C n=1 Tax=Trichostrongylus colubriformis TaxID=6319 RepID=A0AAN8INW9_TRICO
MSRNYVVCVEPNPSRTDSSNLNPQEFWNHGIQLVGLNYQTPGLMVDLQEGRFSENGGCGYVLKPAIMNEDLFIASEKPPTTPQILHLRVLSGQQLPRPRNSNAKVILIIMDEEEINTCSQLSIISGHNPSFDESFQFQVSVPELALVRFLVLDDDFIGDDFIGQYTVPFECLQPGFRHVPLLNNEGDPLPNATLFVHIAITNKRGGGKAKKRGMSVKRKSSRVNTGMKLVGIKTVDDQFKTAVAPLCESIAMRNKLEAALIGWQEECGLGPAGTIRQGIRLIHSRMMTLAVNSTPPSSPSAGSETSRSQDVVPSFMIDSDDKNFPVIIVTGQIPDQLQRTFHKLKTLIAHCVATLGHADTLLTKVRRSHAMPWLLSEILEMITTARDRILLKSQLCLVSKSQDEAQDIITQVFDTGGVLGILSPKMMGRSGRRFSRVIHDPIRDSAL